MSKVSIIIPSRNRFYILRKTIESYIISSFVNEVIVVDDNSDIPYQLDIPKVKIIRNSCTRGALTSKLIGVENATNRYVFFGEDDAFIELDTVERLMDMYLSSDTAGVASRIAYLNPKESLVNARERYAILENKGPYLDIKRIKLNHNFKTNKFKKIVPFLHALYFTEKFNLSDLQVTDNFDKGNGFREETYLQLLISEKTGKLFVSCDFYGVYHMHYSDTRKGGQRVSRFFRFYYSIYYTNKILQRFPRLSNVSIINYSALIFIDLFVLPGFSMLKRKLS